MRCPVAIKDGLEGIILRKIEVLDLLVCEDGQLGVDRGGRSDKA